MRTLARSALSLALVLLATAAHAGSGVNIRWSQCLGDGGTLNRNFACDTNSGTEALVCSFVLADDFTFVSGQEIHIDLLTQGTALPAWWALRNAGTCRQNALGMNTVVPPEAVNCADWAEGAAVSAIGAYTIGARGPNSARIVAVSAVSPDANVDLFGGREYFSANITINHTKTVGTGACDGCSVGACIVFTGDKVTTLVESINRILTGPTNGTDSNFVTWQGGTVFPSDGVNFPCPYPVPTKRSTWGAVKALYR